jgi:DNA-binding CsgD family transcriptional regulator
MKEFDTVPAGLADDNVEFFVLNGEPVFLQGGKMFQWDEMTIDMMTNLRKEMDKDHKVQKGFELLGIHDPMEQMKKFIFCRFGALNSIPDYCGDGNLNSEYWDCGCRPCPADGFLCKYPDVEKGQLTIHEVAIVRQICQDKSNKMIANAFGRSIDTVNKEIKRICEKIGCHTKYGVAAFAGQNNIL